MKVEKFKVLLYLKKSEPDKTGKAPIMGRITLNRTMAQFSCKLSCTPGLWNARESRLNGKSREAVETNEKIERLLLAVHLSLIHISLPLTDNWASGRTVSYTIGIARKAITAVSYTHLLSGSLFFR